MSAHRKSSPDGLDKAIAILIGQGHSIRAVASHVRMRHQSVEGRIVRLKANRWMTINDRLLSPCERDRVLKAEREAIKVSS